MNKRIVNKQLIREWIKINGRGAATKLAYESGCSPSLIQKLCSDDYAGVPSIGKIEGLCKVTGFHFDELFPIFDEKKKSA